MAKTIKQLPEATVVSDDDLHVIFDNPGGAGSTKKVTHANLKQSLPASGIPFTPAGTIAATNVQAAIEEVASEAATTDHGALTGLGDDDHPQYQREAEKGVANGYASLDAGAKVPVAQLGTGTPDGAKFLRDDRTWANPGGSAAFPATLPVEVVGEDYHDAPGDSPGFVFRTPRTGVGNRYAEVMLDADGAIGLYMNTTYAGGQRTRNDTSRNAAIEILDSDGVWCLYWGAAGANPLVTGSPRFAIDPKSAAGEVWLRTPYGPLDLVVKYTPSGTWGSAESLRVKKEDGRLVFGGSSGPQLYWGSGSPEGAVTAPVGSIYLRSGGAAGTTFYSKESGTGNTGWKALGERDTTTVNFIIDGNGSAITTGIKGDITLDFAGTITGWTVLGDQSGSIVVDIWKDTYANYPPTVADTITGAEKPTLSAAIKNQDLALAGGGWAFSAGDTFRWNVDSATTVTRVTVALKIVKS